MRIAITKDTRRLRCRLLVKLISLCGAEPVLVPYMLKPSALRFDGKCLLKDTPDTGVEIALKKHLIEVNKTLLSCDAIIIPGNKNDVPPRAYGDLDIHPETAKRIPKNPRDVRYETEMGMVRYALERGIPLLGICGGMQITNVALGGRLIQHLPDDERVKKGGIKHRDPRLKALTAAKQKKWEHSFEEYLLTGVPENIYPATHGMSVERDSILGEIYQNINPNLDLRDVGELSIHHQGCFVEDLSKSLRPIAMAPDGVVEAAEFINKGKRCLLTQFHPECDVSGIAKAVVQQLVDSAR